MALATWLAEALPPGYDVTPAWAWRAGDDEFIPDVMVHAVTDEDARFTGIPALVWRCSPGTGARTWRSTAPSAAARLPHLWVVDADAGTLDVFRLGPDGYRLGTRHTAANGRGPVDVAFGVASAEMDLPTLL